jgi:flavin reductase (DIM6/NTAB) family NADH-FMN oxidoreductase RutF/pimeloyl-ACP methyl ester carboxylesterase
MTGDVARRRSGASTYIEDGAGEPVVLIHGVGLNAAIWAPQIEALSKTHRVIALDMAGHGQSARPPVSAGLADYVDQLTKLLDDLEIEKANLIGHSMGGLVALGFALANPDRVLRLGVLNGVYQRSPEARAAVAARSAEVAAGTSMGDIEKPLARWFGESPSPARETTRAALLAMSPSSYAVAYRIFAEADRLFVGQLGKLAMPTLFATGSADPNSTPAMSEAMAAAVQRGRARIFEGAGHMMALAQPVQVNLALRYLLAEPLTPFAPNDLRQAFGSFMTGVTVITTMDQGGLPRGFTANSFTSVSLDPPLLLICIGKKAMSHETFSKSPGFAVNILSEFQKDVSGIFASKRSDKFNDVHWHKSATGNPLIDGAIAWFDCTRYEALDAGDHVVIMGAIRSFSSSDVNPLGYARGGYVTLGLEQAAVNAASGGHTIVGAILECQGKLVMVRDAAGRLGLPEVGRDTVGSASRLVAFLRDKGVTADLGFLFAVFENPGTHVQTIYYRGDAAVAESSSAVLVGFDAWDGLPDDATRVMLRRYSRERLQGRFKIYAGDHERGTVQTLDGPPTPRA